MLPLIWMLLALLARIAEKAQSATCCRRPSRHVARKTLMPLPFWPVPPPARRDALDAVAGDHRAVVADLPAMHQDAAIAAVRHGVAGDLQPAASTE